MPPTFPEDRSPERARDRGVELQLPMEKDDRRELMRQLIHMMAIDGELAQVEKELCATASAKMELTSEEFTQILDSLLQNPDQT